ncbi:hypothetical protein [Streptomyces sp. NPDC001492]
MIALNLPAVPVPDAVAVQVGSQIPARVLEAEKRAENAAYCFRLSRGPRYEEARQWALAEIAAANKVLGAWNPRLVARIGGAR